MENDPSFEQAAERIVAWAARNPLSSEEAQKRYRHLLAGLPSLPAQKTEWAIFTLGKLAVRYLKGRVEEIQQSRDDPALLPAFAFRGAAPTDAGAAAERILKAAGTTGSACVKLTENPGQATVGLTLWIEPKEPKADIPFVVTVFGAGESVVAGPVECAGRSVLKFAAVEPAEEYTIVFKSEAEKWRIQWGIAAAQA